MNVNIHLLQLFVEPVTDCGVQGFPKKPIIVYNFLENVSTGTADSTIPISVSAINVS